MNRKVLVIGLDGTTFDVINPLIKEGWLPGFGISLIVVVPTVLLMFLGGAAPVLSMVVGVVSCLGAWSVGLLLL